MGIRLEVPTINHKEKALAYREEHFAAGENVINGSEMLDQTPEYEKWLCNVQKNADPEQVDPNWVLTDTYFAVEEETGQIIGIIDYRHELKGFLVDFGHCGYSVSPSRRRKGYATQMLAEVLKLAKEKGQKELQLSVERSNLPSIRTIEKNGGVYERSFEFQGEWADVYKVRLQ